MVVIYVLQASTGAELDNKNVGRRIIFLFKVFDILDNVGLLRSQSPVQKSVRK